MRPLSGRERLHRERVDFFAHAVPKRGVDSLVALYARFPGKGCRHDHCLEMRAITLHDEVFTIEFIVDISLYCFWSDHGAI